MHFNLAIEKFSIIVLLMSNNKTPRTNTAAYNGHADLLATAKQLETELALARETLQRVADAMESGDDIDAPDWILNCLDKTSGE